MAIAVRSNSQTPYPILSAEAFPATLAVRETRPAGAPKPRLLDRVREAIRARHYSRRTEKAYVHWIKRYILFHGMRHPAELGAPDVTAFLTSLAVHDKVAASTQNRALSALLFKAALIAHLERAHEQYQADLRQGAGWVELPNALTRKYPNAGPGLGVAMGVPGHALLRGASHRPASSPPPA